MERIINQDGRRYRFKPGKRGSLISPSRNIGKPGLLGTYEPNPVKSKAVPTPLVPRITPQFNPGQSVPGATRGMLPKKRRNIGIVRALGSSGQY